MIDKQIIVEITSSDGLRKRREPHNITGIDINNCETLFNACVKAIQASWKNYPWYDGLETVQVYIELDLDLLKEGSDLAKTI